MLTRLVGDAKEAVESRLTNAGSALAVAGCGGVAAVFFTAAAFLWAQSLIGPVYASLALGAAYLLLGGVLHLRARHRARMAAAAARARAADLASAMTSDPLAAPAMISAAVDFFRKIGAHRLIPVFVIGAIAAAALQQRESDQKDKS